jgi:xylitol oxidase
MNRKSFISTLAATGFGAGILSNWVSCSPKVEKIKGLKNWAGNYTYKAAETKFVSTVEEMRRTILGLKKAKALGTQHCFNDIADTSGTQLCTQKMNQVLELDTQEQTVLVGSGIKYGTLGKYLHQRGWALHNLASLPHISVGGSCATATHGSGISNGNLATAIRGFEWLTVEGQLLWVDPKSDPEMFYAGGVSMGVLGFMTKIKLAIQPTFEVEQRVYEQLPMAALENHFDEIMGAGYSVSFFTHWLNKTIDQVWVKSRVGEIRHDPNDFYGATPAMVDLHPIKVNSPVNCTSQLGSPGPWHERLPHFRMDFTPSNGDELQSEYFVPRSLAFEALMAVESLRDQISPILYVTEVRCIASDEFWMSTAYQRESVAIHFTWKPMYKEVMVVLPMIEGVLKPFGVRPHWGKIFTLSSDYLREQYSNFDAFLRLKGKLDPEGILTNDYVKKFLI